MKERGIGRATIRRTTGRLLLSALIAAGLAVAPLSPALAAKPEGQKSAAAQASEKININTATADRLETLPGIGPALAERIVAYRKENGPFKRVEELMNVKGIGEKLFAKIRDRITVGSS